MAALGGSRHALINLSTQIDIPPIIKKSLSPATGYPAVLFRGHDRRGNRKDVQYVAQHDTVQTDKLF